MKNVGDIRRYMEAFLDKCPVLIQTSENGVKQRYQIESIEYVFTSDNGPQGLIVFNLGGLSKRIES